MNTLKSGLSPVRAPLMISLLLIAAHTMGCQEQSGTVGSIALTDLADQTDYDQVESGEVAMRRLTQAQFKNSVSDIFGSDVVVPKFSEPDTILGGLLIQREPAAGETVRVGVRVRRG